jgi:FAD binding domain/Berberine and berberine like
MQTNPRKFGDFPRSFRGSVLRPGEPGFAESRRIFNMKRAQDTPALIARVADEDDVACVMRYAHDLGAPVAIRSGGHSSDGSSMPDGALVLDMTAMKGLSVDAKRGICRAESGVLLGELDAATQHHGLVVPAGTVSTTGIAGLTVGGGVGFNMRRFGATVDSLLSCDLVTADGRKVRASVRENPDLFWALRGGGGNFGVVTAFEFKAHEVGPEVLSGVIVFPADQAGEVLAGLREHMLTAPRELAMIAAATACPPFPPISAEVHGKPVLMLIVVYTGPASRGPAIVDGLSRLGRAVAILVGPSPWVSTNRMLDVVAPYGRRLQTRGGYLTKMTDGVIAATVRNLLDAPPPTAQLPSTVQNLWCMGGAISEDFDEDSTAFSRAGAAWFWESIGQWDGADHDATYAAWTDRTLADVSQDLRANGYVNLTEDLGPAWLRGLYGSEGKYRRLVDAKRHWDPLNLLRFNKNFLPGDDHND